MGEIYLSSLGGSGENGRNCHLIEYNNEIILLDCGVKREIKDGNVGFYPHLTKEIVSRIKFVLLSHCHEDHVASIPLLYHLGYEGKVYATKETIKETLGFINKWCNFVKKNNGELPYNELDIDKINFEEITFGKQIIENIYIEVFKSGHVLGSCAYVIELNNKKILYTGDMTFDSMTLKCDGMIEVDAAIINCAYASKTISQSEQKEELIRYAKNAIKNKTRILFPVPTKGRAIDILKLLDSNLDEGPIYVEKGIIDSLNELVKHKEYIQDGIDDKLSNKVIVVENKEKALSNYGVYLSGDGMITTDNCIKYYEALKNNPDDMVVISGHAAYGTLGALIFDDNYRNENDVRVNAKKVILKVHLDDNDVIDYAKKIKAKNILLFHANEENCHKLIKELKDIDVLAKTIKYPSKLKIN